MVNCLPVTRLATWLLSALAFAASIGIIALLPAFLGLSWSAIGSSLAGVPVLTLMALAGLWIAGLLVHTVVLQAAMPGLSRRRALLLNVSGSAVSNLFPFGGAAGMGLGYVMTRSWNFPSPTYASYTAITNVWNVLAKLLVGSALLGVALLYGLQLPAGLNGVMVVGALGMLALVLAAAGVVASTAIAGAVGTAIDRVGRAFASRGGRSQRPNVRTWILKAREESASAVTDGWVRLTCGVLAYMLLQAVLLAACLAATGAHATLLAVAVTFGIERLLTVLPFTPGGSGLTELGSAAVLVAMGVAPVEAAAGILLYRLFTFVMEIPVGGVSALWWLHQHRVTSRRQAVA